MKKIDETLWSENLRKELGRGGKPMPRQVFERWVKKAEKVTGEERYRNDGKGRMYLTEEMARRIREAIEMRYA